MSASPRVPVFDGHNDTLTQIRKVAGTPEARGFLERSDHGHLDLPRAREGGFAGGFFAVFTESPDYERVLKPRLDEDGREIEGGFTVDLPPRLPRRTALSFTLSVISDLYRLVERAGGTIEVVRTVDRLRHCIERGRLAVILHIEGAEAIDTRLEALDVLHAAGLRSLGPVWSRPNAFGHGVPFAFPGHPDTGPGLTGPGRRLVRRCNALGILVDLSHLNERGFWDVARISDAPLVATHSNAHALCATPRNLTDAQIDAIGSSGGIIGINFAIGFLRADGRRDAAAETPLGEIVRHARYIADRIGVEHVALGSDFDGASVPGDVGDVTGLPRLLDAFREAGFGEDDVALIAYRNWQRVLDATWMR